MHPDNARELKSRLLGLLSSAASAQGAGSTTGGSGGAGVTFANPLVTVLRLLDAAWVS